MGVIIWIRNVPTGSLLNPGLPDGGAILGGSQTWGSGDELGELATGSESWRYLLPNSSYSLSWLSIYSTKNHSLSHTLPSPWSPCSQVLRTETSETISQNKSCPLLFTSDFLSLWLENLMNVVRIPTFKKLVGRQRDGSVGKSACPLYRRVFCHLDSS